MYAQFFNRSSKGEYTAATGERAQLELNPNADNAAHLETAYDECARRGYVAWQFFKHNGSTPLSLLWTLTATEQELLPAYLHALRTNVFTRSIGDFVDLEYATYSANCKANNIEPLARNAWETRER
jgi:hypothetical protein